MDTVDLDLDHCKRLQHAYSIFPGIPRLCFKSLGLRVQLEQVTRALNKIKSIDDLLRAASHLLVRVEPADNEWLTTRTELMSDYIAELVFERIRTVLKARFSEKLMEDLAYPDTHSIAGSLFKHAAHFSIRKGLTLSMTPLPSGTKLDVYIPGTPVTVAKEKSRYYSLSIREKPRSQNVHADFLNLYMTPISKSQPSVDAVFISPEYITFLFQMTVSPHHPIDFRGLDTVINKLPAKAQKDIRIVFITPAQVPLGEEFKGIQTVQSIVHPHNADTEKIKKFEGLPQYVCQLDTNTIGWV